MTIFGWLFEKSISLSARTADGIRQYLCLATVFVIASHTQAQIAILKAPTNVVTTGIMTNLRIAGPGYFVLRDPSSARLYATRFGEFAVDENGYLVSSAGMRVQGYCDAGLSQFGDVQISNSGAPNGDITPICNYSIGPDGGVTCELTDGTSFTAAQILLQNFSRADKLSAAGFLFYTWDATAGPLDQPAAPGSVGLGLLQTGGLEYPVASLALNQVRGPAPISSHGLLHATGVPTDLGIEGNGYFVLRDTNSDALFASRAGAFQIDPAGYLINYSGLRVQGFMDDQLTTVGDLQIKVSATGYELYWFSISRSGEIVFMTPDGVSRLAGQIMLRDCLQPEQLVTTNFSLFPINSNSPSWTARSVPEENGLGWIESGTIEVQQYDDSLLAVRRQLKCFEQGPILFSTNQSDLAVNGFGFFVLRNPADKTLFATRSGHFQLDAAGHLIATNGWRLQGLTGTNLSEPGDLSIDAAPDSNAGETNATVESFCFDSLGGLTVELADGSQYERGQLTLQEFANRQALQSNDGIYFTNLTAAQPLFTKGLPNTYGLGSIVAASLESIPSYRLPELDRLPQTGFRLQINNLAYEVTVEMSGDLVHWTALGLADPNEINAAEFFDTNALANANRFYRVH